METTGKEVIEGNKLIAEFMGGVNMGKVGYALGDTIRLDYKPYQKWTNIYGGSYEETTLYFESDLQYNSSWDWLMPVVEKIAADYDVKITWMPTAINVTYIERPDTFDDEISSMGGMSAIENTWHSVVRFIEWYNRSKKL